MDQYNVQKAILTTINRAKIHKNQKDIASDSEGKNKMIKLLENFKNIQPKGQLSHQDVIDISKKAPERIYKFFWFNPILTPEEEENSYKILEEHFNKGFCGVKIHSAFNLINFPRDILKLIAFMQDYDKNILFYIHSLPKTSLFKGISSKDIAKVAKKFPELRLIVGHAAYSMEYAIEIGVALKNYENIFFETSLSASLGIYNLIKTVGHKKILYGSDSPTTSTLALEIDKIITLPRISKEIKQDILYNNVSNLLKI